jgi:hypothetical protein
MVNREGYGADQDRGQNQPVAFYEFLPGMPGSFIYEGNDDAEDQDI